MKICSFSLFYLVFIWECWAENQQPEEETWTFYGQNNKMIRAWTDISIDNGITDMNTVCFLLVVIYNL